MPVTQAARNSRLSGLVALVFFVSGFPALLYQLVWQRALFSIYGTNIESITVVVAALMLGLGLGSLAGGALSIRPGARPLRLFAQFELVIGGFGFVSLNLIQWVGDATLGAGTFQTGLLSFLLVLLPTVLMGATLPLLVHFLVERQRKVGSSVGLLYFVNTLGSAAACFAAVAWLMGHLGMQGVVTLAATLNLLVGAGAWLTERWSARNGAPTVEPTDTGSRPAETQSASPSAPDSSLLPFSTALLASGALGFVSLSYEILWARVYSITSHGEARAFPLLLGAFLMGIALGSACAPRFCRAASLAQSLQRLGMLVLLVAGGAFFVAPLVGVAGVFLDGWGRGWPWTLGYVVLLAGGLGAVFPILSHVSLSCARVGARFSYLYFANILGSTLGSLLTGFVLLDLLSLAQTSALITTIAAAVGGGLALLAGGDGSRRRIATAAAVVVIAVATLGHDALYDGALERMQMRGEYQKGMRFDHVIEGRSGIVSVMGNTVYGGGAYDGRFNVDPVDDVNGITRAYALAGMREAPGRMLMIGLSTGSWAQVLAHHPGIDRLDIIEINPSYLELIRDSEVVRSVLENPKVHIHIDDGRRWLTHHNSERFDAIVMNATYNWRAYNSNLLSREFVKLARSRLVPGGLLYYNTTESHRVYKTALEAFEYGMRVYNFVVVSDEPVTIDPALWRERLLTYTIDGRKVFDLEQPEHQRRLDEMLTMAVPDRAENTRDWGSSQGSESLRARVGPARPITDDNMGTEWDR